MVSGDSVSLIIYLVQLMTGLVVALGGLLGAGLLVSYHQKRVAQSDRAKSKRIRALETRVAVVLANVERVLREMGPNKGVIDGYGLIRTEIAKLEIGPEKGRTEREFVDSLKELYYFADAHENLVRLYQAYERARFGRKDLSDMEVDGFVQNARGILQNVDHELKGNAG